MKDQGRVNADGTSLLGTGQDIAECWLALAPALGKKRTASDSTAVQKRAMTTEDRAASVQAGPLPEGGPSSPQPENNQAQPDHDDTLVSFPET